MDEKIQKYFFGNMTDEEKSYLFSEMENNAEMKEEFVRIQNNYSLAQMISQPEDKQFAETGFKQFRQRIHQIKMRHITRLATRYAAILLLVIGLAWGFQMYLSNQDEEEQYQEYTTEVGRRKEITLPDGTKVHLGPSSSLKVPAKFTSETREVQLDGEALFDVTADSSKPFIVQTSTYSVKVLGTVFSTIAYSQYSVFETSLLEGSVIIYNQEEKVELKPHEGVALVDDKLVKSEADLADIYYLQSGLYKFEEATLRKLLNKISMWYGVDFDITNNYMLGNTLSGKFRENDDVEFILTAMQSLYPFKYKKSTNNTYIIY
ncbi:FecR family protein [Bacteroides sp. 519]|uniref:FecR family protein n=1 Tax=Bacteroides sp. 519 TaxID=2302937 RepID=UPI0013D859C1|nr:FecR family protein [Bacteroides sp. 519]NDV60113.1 FecR family protein [Bacteroides sp. 519]